MTSTTINPTIILASSSAYRRSLMERLQLPFTTNSPDIDERHLDGESPADLVKRLSISKAQKVSNDIAANTNAAAPIIIGSDQVSINSGNILGKPHTLDKAIAQLKAASGRSVEFLTGLAVIHGESVQYKLVTTTVQFRDLGDQEIIQYIRADQPLDCAGSFKSEALGITLFKQITSEDPTALEGLPLITLSDFLRNCGVIFGK